MFFRLIMYLKSVKWRSVAAFLTLFNGFFLQAYLLRFNVFSYPSNLQEILLGMQVFAFLFYLVQEKRVREASFIMKKYRILLLVAVLSGISVIWAVFSGQAVLPEMLGHLKFVFFAVVYVGIFLMIFESDQEQNRAFKVLGQGAVFFGVSSLIYNLSGFNRSADYRLQGPLDSAVYMAMYLAPFLIYFVISYVEEKSKRELLYYTVVLAVLLLLTRSMAALLSVSVVLGVYFLRRYQAGDFFKKNWKVISSVTIVVVLAAAALFYTRIGNSLNQSSSSFVERIEIYRTAQYLISQNSNWLLGLGLGQFQPQYEKNAVTALFGKQPLDFKVLQPHNVFWLIWFQWGLLGLLGLIYVVLRLAGDVLYLNFRDFSFYHVFPFIVLYFLLQGAVDAPFFKNDLMVLVLLSSELWRAYQKQEALKEEVKRARPSFGFVVIAAMFAIYLLINSIIMLNPRWVPYFFNSVLMRREMLFHDVYKGHPHYEAISYVTRTGKILAYSDDTFRPDQEMSRGEFVDFFMRAAGYNDLAVYQGGCFRDVNEKTLYSGAICYARREGFIQGDENGEFRPGWRISKSEAFVILARIQKWPIAASSLRPFNDPNWFQPYVDYVASNRLLDYDWERFEKWHPITRGELAELVFR